MLLPGVVCTKVPAQEGFRAKNRNGNSAPGGSRGKAFLQEPSCLTDRYLTVVYYVCFRWSNAISFHFDS
ncbi:hypothetical protein Y032_0006g2939 [Ancylostoma ceylanicum]|uniref:Uncharacterized protein n=1 Tax=Ancylostoma ceylanicum TaxID=53326 RepID=A0A016VP46_9BILA|nr:hypothetical protein Y032_0006g2939 [Ancylostoma ceylanicum]